MNGLKPKSSPYHCFSEKWLIIALCLGMAVSAISMAISCAIGFLLLSFCTDRKGLFLIRDLGRVCYKVGLQNGNGKPHWAVFQYSQQALLMLSIIMKN